MPKTDTRRNVCVVDTGALKHNYNLLSAMSKTARPISVVKADAYGHTVEICVPVLLSLGCDFFAVSCTEEAIAVRKICRRADCLIPLPDPAIPDGSIPKFEHDPSKAFRRNDI
jgi:alanine racemase